MTLIAAYIYGESVHMIADSALTITSSENEFSPTDSFSCFGEKTELIHNGYIIESEQKIIPISKSIVVSYSGCVTEGKQIIEDLRIRLEIKSSCKLKFFFYSLFLELNPSKTQFIIGYYEDANPKIFYFDSKSRMLTKKNSYVILGSGRENLGLTTPLEILKKTATVCNSPDAFLISFISLAQCCSLNSQTFKSGIGGSYNGLYIYSDGIMWIGDTCNILYSSWSLDRGELFIVNKFNRDDAVHINSKHSRKVIFNSMHSNPALINEWTEKWMDKLLCLNNLCETRFYVFLCYDRRIITILDRQNNRLNQYLKYYKLSDTEIKFSIHEELKKILLTTTEADNDAIEGFGVNITYL